MSSSQPSSRSTDYEDLLFALQDPVILNKWFEENYKKVEGYEILRNEIIHLLNLYTPGKNPKENIEEELMQASPNALASMLTFHFLDIHTKLSQFDIELGEIPGSEIAGRIINHKKKVLKVVEEYEEMLKKTNEEVHQCNAHIAHLDSELTAALLKIQYLEKGTTKFGGLEDSVDEEEFIAHLQRNMAASNSLTSSMKREVQKERKQNKELQRRLALLKKEKIAAQEECMQDLAMTSNKNFEFDSRIEGALRSIIEERGEQTPSAESIQKVIQDWKEGFQVAIKQNEDELNRLLITIDALDQDLIKWEAVKQDLDLKLEDAKHYGKRNKELLEIYGEEYDRLKLELTELTETVNNIEGRKQALTEKLRTKPSGGVVQRVWRRIRGEPSPRRSPKYQAPIDNKHPKSDVSESGGPVTSTSHQPIRSSPARNMHGSASGAPLPSGGVNQMAGKVGAHYQFEKTPATPPHPNRISGASPQANRTKATPTHMNRMLRTHLQANRTQATNPHMNRMPRAHLQANRTHATPPHPNEIYGASLQVDRTQVTPPRVYRTQTTSLYPNRIYGESPQQNILQWPSPRKSKLQTMPSEPWYI